MAQSTAGIKLFYGASIGGEAPVTWTEIPDITSTPALGSAPAQLDSTTLAETAYKTYIPGLQDLGGSFEFAANMTPELVAAVDAAAEAPTSGDRAFKISFPAPLEIGYWWTGEVQPVAPGEASVDAVATTTVYVSQESALTKLDESGIS